MPHTFTRILASPSVTRALWQLPLTAFHPHPPGGGDVPEGTEVFGPFLSPAGSRVTSTAPLLRPGVPSWVPGPGRRQAQTLRPLLGEQREALLSTAHPPAPTTGSPSGLSSGCAGTWGWGGRGLAEGLSGPGQGGVWAVCGSTDTGHWLKPGCTPYLGSSVAHSLRAPQGWPIPLLPLWSLSQLPRRPGGDCSRDPLVKTGGLYCNPGPTVGQSCGPGMHSTQRPA